MNNRYALFLLLVLSQLAISILSAAQSTVPQDVQSLADGFYYKTPQGWQKLEPISMAGGGLKHVGKMFVPGLTPQMVWTFRDAESPVQIENKRPTFCIKEMPVLLPSLLTSALSAY